jgi:DNA-binding GntR family transcriptional regulator
MNQQTQTQSAFNELRRRILALELAPNERLKEETWASKLNVSRAAIRESLTRLLGEGLVYPGERGGFFVTEMNERDVRELRELREILETAAFELACDRVTPNQVKEIIATCDDFAHMAKKEYVAGACEVDLRFHHLLVSASGNTRIAQVYQKSNIPLFHRQLGRSPLFMNDMGQTEREHRAIAMALKEKDAAKGVRLLRAHFRRGEKGVLKASTAPRK